MKTIIVKTFNKLLEKKVVSVFIVNDDKIDDIINWRKNVAERNIHLGQIDEKYEIEIHDKINITTMIA